MEEIITDELIRYKSGFISGKNEIVEALKIGKIIDLNNYDDNSTDKDTWYTYGYEDGIKYFISKINNNKLDLANINTKEIMKSCFTKKVIEINQEQDKKIPISKFRI